MPQRIMQSASPALALARSPIPALRRLVVVVSDETVVLQGQLPSYYFKQLAQETVMPTLAGRRLLNRVEVVRDLVEVVE
jgi:hypothetical protein